MDEATSSLDAETESKIQEAIHLLTKNKTAYHFHKNDSSHRSVTDKDVDLKVREEEQKLKEQKEQRRKRKEQKIKNEQNEISKAAEMQKIKEWGENFEIEQKLKERKERLKDEKLRKAEEEKKLKYWADA